MGDRRERYREMGLHTEARIGWALHRASDRWPDREFLVLGEDRLTFSDVNRWSTAVAHDLLASGIGPGDRLLWQLPNSLEAIVLHLAAWRIGAVSSPVVPLYRERELASIIRDVEPAVVACAATHGSRCPPEDFDRLTIGKPPKLRIVVGGEYEGYATVRPLSSDDGPMTESVDLPVPAGPDDCCLILFTSGTSAEPKGVRHSSNSLLAEAMIYRDVFGIGCHDTIVMGAPITHIGALLMSVILPLTCGARSCLLPAWDADAAIEMVAREKATLSTGAAVFLQAFVERYEREPATAHRLPVFICGGAAVPPSLIERAEVVGIAAMRCWGMTESPGLTLAASDEPLERRANFDGRRCEQIEIQAVDGSRRPLRAGQEGHLRIRSPGQMLGYIDPAATAAQVDADGWLYTGDVGIVDAGGWVKITGRVKDIINRGGEKFSAQDIEDAIASHPAIAGVAVVGVPDERLGEKVAAFVTLRPGAAWPGRQALFDHLEEARMAKQKFPVAWRILDEFPMTMSGKTKKHELLDKWNSALFAGPEAPDTPFTNG